MRLQLDAHYIPNWTSAAGALEGVLGALGTPLPRHAIMGLSGHAFHFRLGFEEGVVALPSGPLDLDWEQMTANYGRLGWRWERFGARLEAATPREDIRAASVSWALPHLEGGRPLVGFDFHLHEFAIVLGYDSDAAAWLVDDLLSGQYGLAVPVGEWPGPAGWVELIAPVEPLAMDPVDAVEGALVTARDLLIGDGANSGSAGLDAWAEALEGDTTVDRAGQAYTIAVLIAARSDGAAFLHDLAHSLPELAESLTAAASALDEEVKALAPLASLFPFPAGGHGGIDVPGLRRAAAMPIRRAAAHERRAVAAIESALAVFAAAD